MKKLMRPMSVPKNIVSGKNGIVPDTREEAASDSGISPPEDSTAADPADTAEEMVEEESETLPTIMEVVDGGEVIRHLDIVAAVEIMDNEANITT
jgi:hypothetical protein